MPTIERRPGRRGRQYRVKIRCSGVVRSATFHSLAEARQWGYTTEGTIRSQRYAPRLEAAHHTLGELLARYGREVLPTKSPGTIAHQAYHLDWWTAQLGTVRLLDVTPPQLGACRDRLATRCAGGTVNQYLATLSHALTVAAREWGWLEASPMPAVRRCKEPRGRVRVLSDAERQHVLAACQASANRCLYPVVVLALSTGARKMEILGLTWREVDLKRSLLTFPTTKNGEPRTVPLTGEAVTIMQHHIRRIDTDLVFPRRDGRQPADIRSAWKQARHAAGLVDFHFHDLRHSAASYLAMSGASLPEIGAVLGHKTPAATQRYIHLTEAHTRNLLTRMTRGLFL